MVLFVNVLGSAKHGPEHIALKMGKHLEIYISYFLVEIRIQCQKLS